jgi:hypothetical protein
MIAFDTVEDGSRLVGCLQVDVHARDQAEHVTDVPIPLAQRLTIDLGKVAIVLARLGRPLDEVRDDAPQVRHPVLAGSDRIVPHVLGLRAWVAHAQATLRQVLVHPVVGSLDNPLVECPELVLGCRRPWNETVPPVHRIVIVHADAPEEILGP